MDWKWIGFWVVSLVVCFPETVFGAGNDSFLAPYLTENDIKAIHQLKSSSSKENLEAVEKRYHQITHQQVVSDLITLYSHLDETELAFPSFTPDGPHRQMGDFGFGFHLVRRLTFPLPDGEVKVIEVNEAWNQDRKSGGLFYPDDIRVKTRVFSGERHIKGSDEQYLYDVFRLAWGPEGQPLKVFRRTRFTWDPIALKNTNKKLRVPVSSPLLCVGCHTSPTTRAKRFLAPGETVDHERIVQNSQFALSPQESLGVKEYLAHLKQKGYPEALSRRVRDQIQNPKEAFKIPGVVEAWRSFLQNQNQVWLEDDLALSADEVPHYENLQGFYDFKNEPRLDALERIFPGKYQSWSPQVPFPQLN